MNKNMQILKLLIRAGKVKSPQAVQRIANEIRTIDPKADDARIVERTIPVKKAGQ